MNVLVALNGEIKNHKHIRSVVDKYNIGFIVCADGGVNHIDEMGLIPDMLIGDMDSAKKDIVEKFEKSGVKLLKYPPAKDEIDGQLAVDKAIELNPTGIIIIGAMGKRIDQTMASFHLLKRVNDKAINGLIIDEETIVRVISNKTFVNGEIGDIVSIIPFGGTVKGITLSGFQYPLKGATMDYGYPYGISNVVISKDSFIDMSDGELLFIHYYMDCSI